MSHLKLLLMLVVFATMMEIIAGIPGKYAYGNEDEFKEEYEHGITYSQASGSGGNSHTRSYMDGQGYGGGSNKKGCGGTCNGNGGCDGSCQKEVREYESPKKTYYEPPKKHYRSPPKKQPGYSCYDSCENGCSYEKCRDGCSSGCGESCGYSAPKSYKSEGYGGGGCHGGGGYGGRGGW